MSKVKRRIELLLLGFALFAGGVAASALLIRWIETAETRSLEQRYGPSKYSLNAEEWIIRDFFNDRRNGVFVDVGANDYQKGSNTYYLETVLGWSGIAIDALRQFEEDYKIHRPRTRFRTFFVSDRSNDQAKVYVLKGDTLRTSATKEFTQRVGGDLSEVSTPTITLNDLLGVEGISSFDFLSMDIELAEPQALAGFDIERFHPSLVCIEAHPDVRQQILDYFARHRYVILGKYLRADTENLYFTPLASPPESGGR
jgi:FkbM family methyltransferase